MITCLIARFSLLYVLILPSALSSAASENLCRNTVKIEIARRGAHQLPGFGFSHIKARTLFSESRNSASHKSYVAIGATNIGSVSK